MAGTNRSRKKKNRKRHTGFWLFAAIAAVSISIILVNAWDLHGQLEQNKAKEAELTGTLQEEEQRTRDLEEYSKYTKTDKYVEEVARDKLGLVHEGETVFHNEDGD